MNKIKRFFGMVLLVLIMAAALTGVAAMTINNRVVNSQKEHILGAITDTKDNFLQTEYEEMKKVNAD